MFLDPVRGVEVVAIGLVPLFSNDFVPLFQGENKLGEVLVLAPPLNDLYGVDALCEEFLNGVDVFALARLDFNPGLMDVFQVPLCVVLDEHVVGRLENEIFFLLKLFMLPPLLLLHHFFFEFQVTLQVELQ